MPARRCALFVLVPNRPRVCPDPLALAAAIGERLDSLHVAAWTSGAEPDRRCLAHASTIAARLEEALGQWPSYVEMRGDEVAITPEPSPGFDVVLALAAGERRRVRLAASRLTERSGTHLALVPDLMPVERSRG